MRDRKSLLGRSLQRGFGPGRECLGGVPAGARGAARRNGARERQRLRSDPSELRAAAFKARRRRAKARRSDGEMQQSGPPPRLRHSWLALHGLRIRHVPGLTDCRHRILACCAGLSWCFFTCLLQDRRYEGVIATYRADKGFGFIRRGPRHTIPA